MKAIFTSLSPNTEKDDIFLALKLIFQPWQWKKGEAIGILEQAFKEYLNADFAFGFNSGRSAFLAILESLDLAPGDEILLQAFTCSVVVNPILKKGLKPVFVDIKKENLNLDADDLERKLTPRSRVVLVQHTFGLASDLARISEFCREHNLILIEDCAHSLGAVFGAKKLGTFSRAAFFSLGRGKVISSVYGGIAVTNDMILAPKLKQFYEKNRYPGRGWILQQLLHPVLSNFVVMPLYGILGLGKYVLLFFQKIKLLSKAVFKEEKKGKLPFIFPRRLPNALALLGLNQFRKLERFNGHRQSIAEIYEQEFQDAAIILPAKSPERIYIRYPLILENIETDKVLRELKRNKVFIDDGWRKTPVVPPDTDQKAMQYVSGSCPLAEKLVKAVMNLPTHINIKPKQAIELTKILKEILCRQMKSKIK